MRDEFEALALCGGGLVGLEKGPDNLQPADVLVHSVDNSSSAVKFSVVHRLQPSADFAEARSGKLARQTVVNSNICARMPACPRLGWLFCPFVLEAISTWGGRARHLTQLAGLGGHVFCIICFFPQQKKHGFFSNPTLAACQSKIRPEAPMLEERSWRRQQNTTTMFPSPRLVSAARARVPEPVGRRPQGNPQRPLLVLDNR